MGYRLTTKGKKAITGESTAALSPVESIVLKGVYNAAEHYGKSPDFEDIIEMTPDSEPGWTDLCELDSWLTDFNPDSGAPRKATSKALQRLSSRGFIKG